MENVDIITIAKDENNVLLEWIDYYINLNINHIYIFDDNSIINFKELIETNDKYSKKVTIFINNCNFFNKEFKDSMYYCDEFYNNNEISKQMYFLNYFIKYLYSNKTNWLFHCDVDEYLILKNNNFINNIINTYSECNKIFIPWIVYGTSYIVNYDASKLLKDTFTMHTNNYSHLYKCIFKPQQCLNKIAKNPHFININDNDNIYISGYDKLYKPHELKFLFNNFYFFKYNLWKNFEINKLPIHINHYQFLSVKEFIKRKIFRLRCAETKWRTSKKNTWIENNKCIRFLYDYKINESHDENNDYLPIINYNHKNTLFEMIDNVNFNKMTIDKYKEIIYSNNVRYWKYNDLELFLKHNNYYNNFWSNILKSKNKKKILNELYLLINNKDFNNLKVN